MGCEGYPDCDQTYPLPQRGDIIGTDEICPQCGSPKVKVLGGRRPWVLVPRPPLPDQGRVPGEAGGAGRRRRKPRAPGGKATATARGEEDARKAAATSKAATANEDQPRPRAPAAKKATGDARRRPPGRPAADDRGADDDGRRDGGTATDVDAR